MDINQYAIYSAISSTNQKYEDESQKALGLLNAFRNIVSVDQAKKTLQDKFNITSEVKNYMIGSNVYLDVSESEDIFSMEFNYGDNVEIYSIEK